MTPFRARLTALRGELARLNLDGFILSTGDEHITEWPAPYAKRLAWLTGFTGSTGTAIILADQAAMLVDGRYTVAARDQVDGKDYSFENVPKTSIGAWLAKHAGKGAQIGYDPRLHTRAAVLAVEQALADADVTLAPVTANPVDAVWSDQPPRPDTAIFAQPIEFSGRASADKRRAVAAWLAQVEADAAVLVALDSIAWLFNIRARDVDVAPLGYAFAVCRRDGGADLFVDEARLNDRIRDHLGDGVRLAPYESFYPTLETLTGQRICVDPNLTPIAVHQALARAGAVVREDRDPTQLPKAIKNPVEIAGMKHAHVRDGAALTRFLHWLSVEGPKGEQTELSAASRLTAFRRELEGFHGVSFEPISAADASGALPHYWPTPQSDRPIRPDSIYLIDSGGQFPDGTTDVTRTVAIGTARADVKDRFTRVLRGHIAIARVTFPAGTMGWRLDPLARLPLWDVGLDYALGTGHGVGHFLNVHEGPAHMLGAPRPGDAGIEAGMILSNEPGYYKEGDYGVRIENLVVAVEREVEGAETKLLGFETITMAPIDRALVDTSLMTAAEIDWLDAYHAKVFDLVGPLVPPDTRAWLERQTAPIGRGRAAP